MTITLSPDDRLEEDQDDVEERLDEASSCSSEEDEDDDEYEELHRGVDLCGIGLEPTKSQPNVPKEELMVLLYLDLIEEEKKQYSTLFDKYPKLFATEYTQVRGTHSVLHEIKLHSNAMPTPKKL